MGGIKQCSAPAASDGDCGSSPGTSREDWKCDINISADEEDLIIRLHKLLGDRWGLIAGRLPWRTAQEIEKYWRLRSHGHAGDKD